MAHDGRGGEGSVLWEGIKIHDDEEVTGEEVDEGTGGG